VTPGGGGGWARWGSPAGWGGTGKVTGESGLASGMRAVREASAQTLSSEDLVRRRLKCGHAGREGLASDGEGAALGAKSEKRSCLGTIWKFGEEEPQLERTTSAKRSGKASLGKTCPARIEMLLWPVHPSGP